MLKGFKKTGYATAHNGKWHLGQEDHFPEHQGFDENHGGCDLGQPPDYFDHYQPTLLLEFSPRTIPIRGMREAKSLMGDISSWFGIRSS
jgi:arylsulfatase A-like enzyme